MTFLVKLYKQFITNILCVCTDIYRGENFIFFIYVKVKCVNFTDERKCFESSNNFIFFSCTRHKILHLKL